MAPSQLVIVLLLASHSRILAFVCIPIYERYFVSQTKPLRVPLHASSSDSSSEMIDCESMNNITCLRREDVVVDSHIEILGWL